MNGCLHCNGVNLERVRPYRTNTAKGKEVFHQSSLLQCVNCGLVQSAPRPDAATLERYYQESYREEGYAGSDVADVQRFPNDNLYYCNRGRSIAELVKPFVSVESPRILDIGAGYGHILYFLGEQFPRSVRSAIELSTPCVAHLKSQSIQVFSQPVESVLEDRKKQFDLITLSHVLEHLLDPKDVLRLIQASLAENGLLYIEVPNIPFETLLRYPDHMWAPRFDEPHITFFSEPTLRELVESSGFRMEYLSTAGPQYRYISGLRFRLPPFRSTVVSWMPGWMFRYLRSRKFTDAVRVQSKEESFFQYGGFRLWLRSVWRKSNRV